MEKYKNGDLVKTNKRDKVVILDISKNENKALIFNLSQMHPDIIKIKDIKEKIDDSNCKVIVNKVKISDEQDNDVQKVCDDFEEKLDETKDELVETLRDENSFLKKIITDVMGEVTKK